MQCEILQKQHTSNIIISRFANTSKQEEPCTVFQVPTWKIYLPVKSFRRKQHHIQIIYIMDL